MAKPLQGGWPEHHQLSLRERRMAKPLVQP
jgi:hypothetical protein